MVFHNDVHIRSHGFAASGDTILNHLNIVRREQTRLNFTGHRFAFGRVARPVPNRSVHIIVKEVELYAVITLRHCDFTVLSIFLGLAALMIGAGTPAVCKLACIRAQIVAAFSAQQLINGDAEVFAFDVPQGDIERGDTGKNHRAAILPPEGAFVKLIPDHFVVKRVHADDETGQVPDHAERSGRRDSIGQSGLAVAVDAFVRINPAQDGPPRGPLRNLFLNDVYLRDFHRCPSLIMSLPVLLITAERL